jgi:cytochrome c
MVMTRTHHLIAACVLSAMPFTVQAQPPSPAGSGATGTKAQPSRPPATFGIGRPATPADIAALDIDVGPDGAGLPPGRGTSTDGAPIYAARCASCHGKTGKEGPNDLLVGRLPGDAFPFARDPRAPKTIGSYWPYATTVFDYIRRAMPPDKPGSLRDEEVYSLVAFLLAANELIPADAVVDAASLPNVKMPAREHFVPDTRGAAKATPKKNQR